MTQASQEAVRSAFACLRECCRSRGWSVVFFASEPEAAKPGASVGAEIRHGLYAPPARFEISLGDAPAGTMSMKVYLRRRPGAPPISPDQRSLSQLEASAEETGVTVITRTDRDGHVAIILRSNIDLQSMSCDVVEKAIEKLDRAYQKVVAKLMRGTDHGPAGGSEEP